MSVQVDSKVVINCENASVEEVLAAIESAHLTSPTKLSKEKDFAGADIGTVVRSENRKLIAIKGSTDSWELSGIEFSYSDSLMQDYAPWVEKCGS